MVDHKDDTRFRQLAQIASNCINRKPPPNYQKQQSTTNTTVTTGKSPTAQNTRNITQHTSSTSSTTESTSKRSFSSNNRSSYSTSSNKRSKVENIETNNNYHHYKPLQKTTNLNGYQKSPVHSTNQDSKNITGRSLSNHHSDDYHSTSSNESSNQTMPSSPGTNLKIWINDTLDPYSRASKSIEEYCKRFLFKDIKFISNPSQTEWSENEKSICQVVMDANNIEVEHRQKWWAKNYRTIEKSINKRRNDVVHAMKNAMKGL